MQPVRPIFAALLLAGLAGSPAAQEHADAPLAPAVESASASPESVVQRVQDRAAELVLSALNFVGVPYRRGGAGDEGFDCSGFTRHIFERAAGLVLPRRADEQARAAGLVAVRRSELQPGDLVFFNTLRRTFSHVGIYLGDGRFIHAPRPGAQVRIEDIGASYWARRFTGARRALALASDDARSP